MLRNKSKRWLEIANKIRDNAAKNRIAQFIEDRYRISNARKNWKKLSDLYELYMNKKPIYELIQRLIKYKTLEELTKSLKNKLAKDGINKFRENIDYMKTITTITTIIEKYEDKNELEILKQRVP